MTSGLETRVLALEMKLLVLQIFANDLEIELLAPERSLSQNEQRPPLLYQKSPTQRARL